MKLAAYRAFPIAGNPTKAASYKTSRGTNISEGELGYLFGNAGCKTLLISEGFIFLLTLYRFNSYILKAFDA